MAAKTLRRLLILFLLVTCQPTLAQPDVVIDRDSSVNLAPVLSTWIPPEQATIDDVVAADRAGKFRSHSTLSIPALNRDVWYRFSFLARFPYNHVILNFQELLFNDIEVFYRVGDNWQHSRVAQAQPLLQRPVAYRFFSLPLTVTPDREHTIYFRANSFTHSFVAPRLETQPVFFVSAQEQTIISVLIMGIIVAMTFYVWSLAHVVLEPAKQFAFIGLLISNFLYVFFTDGHLSRLSDTLNHYTGQTYVLITALLYLFHLLYCRFCLELKTINTFVARSNDLVILFVLVATGYALLLRPDLGGDIAIRTSIAAIVMILVASTTALVKRQRGAGYYFLAIVCFFAIVIFKSLVGFGIVDYPQNFKVYTYSGALSLTVLLSLSILKQLSVSRVRQLELERKAFEAEARDSSKGQFLANMGQEIRTPINGVMGMAQLLSESRLDSTQRDYVDVLISSAKNLQNVINDILDLSRVNANDLKLENVDFNLDQLLVYTFTTFSQTNHGKPIKFDLEENYPFPFYLRGDPTRIQQIINNLLKQSFAFTERGSIILKVSTIEATDARATIKFSIVDTSSGVIGADQETLFEPYTQHDNTPIFGDGGNSLALAICKRLVELMGGEIGFECEPGKGCEYWFTISLDIDRQRQRQLEDSTARLKDTNIAAVFGNPLYSRSLASYFKANDITVNLPDYDLPPDEISLAGIDMLLLSNAIGDSTRNWLRRAQMDGTEVLLFNGIDNNVYSHADLRDMHVGVINPPYGISQIIEVIGKLIDGISGDELRDFTATLNLRDLSNLRVLVAEDNVISTKVIEAILKSHGIEADYAATGAAAVELYEQAGGRYDLILMDYQMPELDGCGATAKIREIEHSHSMPPTIIYAITAYTSGDYKIRCMRAGMNGILTKPLQKALLVELLESVNTKHAH